MSDGVVAFDVDDDADQGRRSGSRGRGRTGRSGGARTGFADDDGDRVRGTRSSDPRRRDRGRDDDLRPVRSSGGRPRRGGGWGDDDEDGDLQPTRSSGSRSRRRGADRDDDRDNVDDRAGRRRGRGRDGDRLDEEDDDRQGRRRERRSGRNDDDLDVEDDNDDLRGSGSRGGRPMSPLPEPSQDRNIQQEIEVWQSFRNRHALLPVNMQSVAVDSVSHGYCLLLERIKFVVPPPLRTLKAHAFTASVRLGLFCLTTRSFIGRTWRSKQEHSVSFRGRQSTSVTLNEVVYFHSRITDRAVIGVAELVLTARNLRERQAKMGEYAVGWTYIELFGKRSPPKLVGGRFDDKEEPVAKPLRAGTPRALMFVPKLDDLQVVSHTGLEYRLHSFDRQLRRARFLVPENLLFDHRDIIPGLLPVRAPENDGTPRSQTLPRMLTADQAEVLLAAEAKAARRSRRLRDDDDGGRDDGDDVADPRGGPLPEPCEPQVAGMLKLTLQDVAVYFPSKFDVQLPQLLQANRALQLGVPISRLGPVRVVKVSLVIGLHNGLRQIESHEVLIGTQRSNGVFKSRQDVELRRFSPSPLIAVTFKLYYHFIEPPRQGLIPRLKPASMPLPEHRTSPAAAAGAVPGAQPGATAAVEEVKRVLVATQAYLPSDGSQLFTSNRAQFTGRSLEVPLRGPRRAKGVDAGAGAVIIRDGGIDAAAGDVHGTVKYGADSVVVGFQLASEEMAAGEAEDEEGDKWERESGGQRVEEEVEFEEARKQRSKPRRGRGGDDEDDLYGEEEEPRKPRRGRQELEESDGEDEAERLREEARARAKKREAKRRRAEREAEEEEEAWRLEQEEADAKRRRRARERERSAERRRREDEEAQDAKAEEGKRQERSGRSRRSRRRSSPSPSPSPSPERVRSSRSRSKRGRKKPRPQPRSPSPASDSSASVLSDASLDGVRLPPPAQLLTDPLIVETLGLRLQIDDPELAAQQRGLGMMPQGMADITVNRTIPAQPMIEADPADITLYTPRAAATLGTSAPPLAAELTRADRTRLSRLGFDDAAAGDDLRRSGGRAALLATEMGATMAAPPPSVDMELSDPLQGNEIRLQFAAFRALGDREVGSVAPPPPPRNVYLTFRFYTFDAVRSERLALVRQPDTEPALYVLTAMTDDGAGHESKVAGPPNVAAEYRIDPTLVSPDECSNFAQYLKDKALQVEVWDADSHLPVGEVLLDLAALMRQQQRSVRVGREYDVIASSMTSDIQNLVAVGGAGSSSGGRVVGKVQVLMSNYGFKGQGTGSFRETVVRPAGLGASASTRQLFDPSSTTVSSVGGRTITKALARKMSREAVPTTRGLGRAGSELAVGQQSKDNVITYEEVLMVKQRYDPDDRGRVAFKEFLRDLQTRPDADAFDDFGAGGGGKRSEGKSESKGSGDGGLQGETKRAIVTSLSRALRQGRAVRNVLSRLDSDGDNLLTRSQLEEANRVLECRWTPEHMDCMMSMYGKRMGDYGRSGYGVVWQELLDLMHSGTDATGQSPGFIVLQGKIRAVLSKNRHVDLRSSFLAAPYVDPGVVRWPAFFKALEECGFEVRSSRQSDEAAALARQQRKQITDWRDSGAPSSGSGSGSGSGDKALGPDEEERQWRQRQEEMAQLKMYREGLKKRLFGERLRENITTEYHVYPSFGRRLFFEFNVANPYAHEDTFTVVVEDACHELRVVTDAEEWRFLRRVVPRACGDVGSGAVEEGMLSPDNELLLDAKESVAVPFTFLSLASGVRSRRSRGGELHALALERELASGMRTMKERTVVASVVSGKSGQTVAMLRVHIHPRPFVVDRTIRFYHAEQEVLKRTVVMHPGSGGFAGGEGTWDGSFGGDDLMGKFAYCPNEEVIVSSQEGTRGTREIRLRYKCGAAMERASFYILLFNDKYNAVLHQVWRVWVRPMLRHDVHAILGQGSVVELKLKADRSRRVQIHTSASDEVKLSTRGIDLVAGAFNSIKFLYQPLSAGRKHVHVHLTDVDTRHLVQVWRLTVSASLPQVSRTYTLTLPLGKSVNKKIGYTNPWSKPRVFYLRSSNTSLLRLRDPLIDVAARAKSFIRFSLAPVALPRREEFYIFINDQNEQNEECLLIRANFQ